MEHIDKCEFGCKARFGNECKKAPEAKGTLTFGEGQGEGQGLLAIVMCLLEKHYAMSKYVRGDT